MNPANNIIGGVLAGGLSRRMGGADKSMMMIEGQSLIERVIGRLSPQVDTLIVNANGDHSRFSTIKHPIISDQIDGFAGPLAGIHAMLKYTRQNHPSCTHLASVAADTPFFPTDFVEKALSKLNQSNDRNATIILAKSDHHLHPVFGLWPVSLVNSLQNFLENAQTRKVLAFVDQHHNVEVEFALNRDHNSIRDPFFNINEPQDLDLARSYLLQEPQDD